MAKNHKSIIEEISKMPVVELAQLVKALEEKFGVSAVAPVAAAVAAPEAAMAPEEKSEYKVTLKQAGSEKIKNIKALRSVVQGLALTEAKRMIEEAPTVIAESASKEDAKKIKDALEAAGAQVELS